MDKSLHITLVTTFMRRRDLSCSDRVITRKTLLTQSTFHRPKKVKVRRHRIWTIWWVWYNSPFQGWQCAPWSSNWYKKLAFLWWKSKVVFFSRLTLEVQAFSVVSITMTTRSELMAYPGSRKSKRTSFLSQKTLHALRDATWTFPLISDSHLATLWTAILTLVCSGDTMPHHW